MMDKELLLYNYFSNQLTVQEEQQFNELMKTDMDFKKQFDFENNLKQVIRDKESDNLKAKLIGFEKEINDVPVKTIPRTNYRKWAMAASVALLIGLGWLGYNNFSGTDYNALYNDNFQDYPNTVYAITRGAETDSSFERAAYVAYETNDNTKAIELFTELKETYDSENVSFYLAQSYLKNNQLGEAISLFNEVVEERGEFAPQALWYLSLSYIKDKQKQNAIESLKLLIADARYKKTEAESLLDELE
ncbi:tetratricopeptide repeat protein [Zobellia barbeyronii]|uniref:Tetratricopeptide repeat protein n=1 Tax=Zobellia barbeyronii TaxID=2748009 RepID=A0ABS5W8G6_9FLAO|nr:tetratricopeptide repeat protein [Zobellia barbeyronii]MBT2159627.1 tetratricopeptide repeat protein [Zobellia barbeyronii]